MPSTCIRWAYKRSWARVRWAWQDKCLLYRTHRRMSTSYCRNWRTKQVNGIPADVSSSQDKGAGHTVYMVVVVVVVGVVAKGRVSHIYMVIVVACLWGPRVSGVASWFIALCLCSHGPPPDIFAGAFLPQQLAARADSAPAHLKYKFSKSPRVTFSPVKCAPTTATSPIAATACPSAAAAAHKSTKRLVLPRPTCRRASSSSTSAHERRATDCPAIAAQWSRSRSRPSPCSAGATGPFSSHISQIQRFSFSQRGSGQVPPRAINGWVCLIFGPCILSVSKNVMPTPLHRACLCTCTRRWHAFIAPLVIVFAILNDSYSCLK